MVYALEKDTLIYPTYSVLAVLISELGIVSSSSRGRVDFQSISVEICVTTVSNTTYLPSRSPYTTMYVPLRTSIRFSSCGAHYGVMNPQRDVREGFEPTMSNLKGLGTMPHYTPDKPDSSAFYSPHIHKCNTKLYLI